MALLTAYFDDSGTHNNSPVVTYAGFIGREEVWADLESAWRALLKQHGIKRFHLAHMEAGSGEFDMWGRTRSDMVLHDFRQLILDRDLWGIACSVARADWNELVTGMARQHMSEPDDFCAEICLFDALNFTTVDEIENKVAVVFDDRPHRSAAILRKAQPWLHEPHNGMELLSVTFSNATKLIPLQAADMLAWETYTHVQKWALHRENTVPRPHFKRFLESGALVGGVATRDALERMIPIAIAAGTQVQALEAIARDVAASREQSSGPDGAGA